MRCSLLPCLDTQAKRCQLCMSDHLNKQHAPLVVAAHCSLCRSVGVTGRTHATETQQCLHAYDIECLAAAASPLQAQTCRRAKASKETLRSGCTLHALFWTHRASRYQTCSLTVALQPLEECCCEAKFGASAPGQHCWRQLQRIASQDNTFGTLDLRRARSVTQQHARLRTCIENLSAVTMPSQCHSSGAITSGMSVEGSVACVASSITTMEYDLPPSSDPPAPAQVATMTWSKNMARHDFGSRVAARQASSLSKQYAQNHSITYHS